MATKETATDLSYEQLLEMITSFQWSSEDKCLRVEHGRDRDNGPGCQVYGCIHHLAAAIERQLVHGHLPPHFIHSFLLQLVQRYTLLQRIDGDSVVTEIKRLVQTIGVDLIFIGVGNAYITAFALVARRIVPVEWNKFCDYIDRLEWKVRLTPNGSQSSRSAAANQVCAEVVYNEPVVADLPVIDHPTEVTQPTIGRGLASAFENPQFAAYANSVLGDDSQYDELIDEQADSASNGQPSESGITYNSGRFGWVQGKFGRRK